MFESINEQLRNHFYNDPEVEAMLGRYEARVLDNRLSSFVAAKDILDFYYRKNNMGVL